MKKCLSIFMIVILLTLAVISFVVLPDTVITQFSIGGSNVTTIPKWAAVLLPTLVGVIGGVIQLVNKENAKKGVLLTGIGKLLFFLELMVNH